MSSTTRIIFTTREPLRKPFDSRHHEIVLDALSREDAVRLVAEVMKQEGSKPNAEDPADDPREVTELVEAVGRHARAIVLLSRDVAHGGVRATAENLRQLMDDLYEKFPGDRENSLYASVELSLRRLSIDCRERVKVLAAFRGGVHLALLAQVLDEEMEKTADLAWQLIEVGLAKNVGHGYLRLDPALPSYLLKGMDDKEREAAQLHWAGAILALIDLLKKQQCEDAALSAQLSLLELPNLLGLLWWAERTCTPESVVSLAHTVENLIRMLGQLHALAEASAVREHAARKLGGWGHERAVAASDEVEHLLERGEIQEAHAAAVRLLERCIEAGEDAYVGASYDLARVYFEIGIVRQRAGTAGDALPPLNEARRRFEVLAEVGNTSAARMALMALAEIGNCLRDLGRFDEAAEAYEEAIRSAEARGDQREVAVGKAQLGTVRRYQRQYEEALVAHKEALQCFERLGEPLSVAAAWYNIGEAHRGAGRHEQAERAYRESLSICVQQKNPAGEASALSQLGTLYNEAEQLEDAVTCLRRAADLFVRLRDPRKEGVSRHYLADALLNLGRYDEARRELARAIECSEPYGHVSMPWATWRILGQLESAIGNAEAAAQARRKAIESYLTYRREGGHGTTPAARLCAAVNKALAARDTSELEQYLSRPLDEDTPPRAKAVYSKLLSVLHGTRDSAIAADPELDCTDAAELLLLLETLQM